MGIWKKLRARLAERKRPQTLVPREPGKPPRAPGSRRATVEREPAYLLQPGNLNETTRVRQVPITTVSSARYSCVYQNVQSSLGSTVRSL
jgi:hypothetical protein